MGANESQWEQIEEALSPPTLVNPATGVPYSWGTEDETADFDNLIAELGSG